MSKTLINNSDISLTSFCSNIGIAYKIEFKKNFTEKDLIKLIKERFKR